MLDRSEDGYEASGSTSRLTFKVAAEEREFEQIHRLNHRTFVDEIPQHRGSQSGLLVDRFHDENTYFICLDGDTLVGMVAARGSRPFSLDSKLDDLDRYLPKGVTVCEIRLLAIEKDRRKGVWRRAGATSDRITLAELELCLFSTLSDVRVFGDHYLEVRGEPLHDIEDKLEHSGHHAILGMHSGDCRGSVGGAHALKGTRLVPCGWL